MKDRVLGLIYNVLFASLLFETNLKRDFETLRSGLNESLSIGPHDVS